MNVRRAVDRHECSWDLLTSVHRKEMDEAIRLLGQAASQGYTKAWFLLGYVYYNGQGVKQSDTEAF